MQISFRPQAKKILIIFGAIAVLLIAFIAVEPLLHQAPAAPAMGTSPDAQAAVDAASSFYTLDYAGNADLWEADVCAHATEAGCRAIHAFFAPSVEAMVQENQIQTGCHVIPIRLVFEDGNIHIWQVHITITDPWPALQDPEQDAFIEVEEVDGTWLMSRILFQQEAERFPIQTP